MTEPITDEELDTQRVVMVNPFMQRVFARIDLERNRADEAERAMEANIATLEQCGEELNTAEAEVARLREALEDLSTYTGELWYGTPNLVGKLEQIVRHVRGILGAALAAPKPKEPSE